MAVHGTPEEGMMCKATWDDIDMTNYCEYKCHPSGTWKPANYAEETMVLLIESQYKKYLDDVGKYIFLTSLESPTACL